MSRALVFALLVAGCGSSSTPHSVQPAKVAEPAAAPAPKRELTGKFGDCNAGCRFDFRELEAERPRVVETYCRDATPQCVSFEGVLTPAGKARLKAIGNVLAAAQLEAHYGCGTCVDGTDDTVVLAHDDGRVTEHTYDAQHQHAEVPAINAAKPVLTSLHSAFYTCASSELIQIGSDCVPYEQLAPRPYSRP